MKEQSTLKTDLLFKIASVDCPKKFFNIIKENNAGNQVGQLNRQMSDISTD